MPGSLTRESEEPVYRSRGQKPEESEDEMLHKAAIGPSLSSKVRMEARPRLNLGTLIGA